MNDLKKIFFFLEKEEIEQNKELLQTIVAINKNQYKFLDQKLEQASCELNKDVYKNYYKAFFFVIYRICKELSRIKGVKVHAAYGPSMARFDANNQPECFCMTTRMIATIDQYPFPSQDLLCGVLIDDEEKWISQFADAVVNVYKKYINAYSEKYLEHDIYIYYFDLMPLAPLSPGPQKMIIAERHKVFSK